MAVANTLAYYIMETITAVKSFIVQALDGTTEKVYKFYTPISLILEKQAPCSMVYLK